MLQDQLELERRYVARLYERLDSLRDEAQRALDDVRMSTPGGTHQNRSERDAFARIYEDRVLQLRDIEERLAFGRLELESPDSERPTLHYIGRTGLRDIDQYPLLLDWRVPQARAFYQATAAQPLGARARRHLQTAGRDVLRIDDEIFAEELMTVGSESLQGEGALMASLNAKRTGRMNDIVATIQAEQDAIIRSELRGALVVQGGPGTGKTAVALHRAAYLLYSHREILASSGVLIVGPSRRFLEYIESVLPSLGETGVVLSSLGQLLPGVEATLPERPAVAEVKGSLDMAGLLSRAVRSRQAVPVETQNLEINGETLAVAPELIRTAMQRAWDTRKPHNVARVTFNKAALNALTGALARQLRLQGTTLEDSDLAWLREDIRTSHDVKVALNTAWMPLTPRRLLDDLFARPRWLESLTPTWTPERRALLARERHAELSTSDIPLLDEAAELLGETDQLAEVRDRERMGQRRRDLENARAAIENMQVEGMVDPQQLADGFDDTVGYRSTSERAATDRTWTYGHIVVDEAQELSGMQWRLLMRRNPRRSFTIVGDIAQAESVEGARSWSEALQPHLGSNWRQEELTVNYRTPAPIAAAAAAMALAHGVDVTPSHSVRDGEWPINVVQTADVVEATVHVIGHEELLSEGRTLAVIAGEAVAESLFTSLSEAFGADVGRGATGLGKPISLLSPRESKGLEFDVVVVVEPAQIIAQQARGAAALYVSMTRPTQRLHLVTRGPLPAGIVTEADGP